MPCLVLTGHPCVGKTTVATRLAERAKTRHSKLIKTVLIINEESVCIDFSKRQCYESSLQERKTRSSLKAQVDRSLSNGTTQTTLVIVDSLNYIKGYRYELYCLSKAAGQQHGVVWILNNSVTAKEWNEKRSSEGAAAEYYYTTKQMDELIQRYEPPDARNRWDRPLWKIDMDPGGTPGSSSDVATATTGSSAEDALNMSVYNMHSLKDAIGTTAATTGVTKKKSAFRRKKKERPTNKTVTETNASGEDIAVVPSLPREEEKQVPAEASDQQQPQEKQTTATPTKSLEEQLDALLDEFLLDAEPLKEGLSTQWTSTAPSNVLHSVDAITQKVCSEIVSAQQRQSAAVSPIRLGGVEQKPLSLNNPSRRTISPAELKRHRRSYLQWIQAHPPKDGESSEHGIKVSFVKYVEAQL